MKRSYYEMNNNDIKRRRLNEPNSTPLIIQELQKIKNYIDDKINTLENKINTLDNKINTLDNKISNISNTLKSNEIFPIKKFTSTPSYYC